MVNPKPKPHSFHIVEITWMDHANRSGWVDVAELTQKSNLTRCYTHAFLVHETETEVTISSTVTEDGQVTEPLTIDRRLIENMQILPCARKKKKVKSTPSKEDPLHDAAIPS